MKSAGNDIVALKVIDKQRTCQPVFYSKFITAPELALYQQPALPFENFVWLLWAVKEAAYKYLKRNNAALIFSPSKIIIQQIGLQGQGYVIESNENQSGGAFYSGSVIYDVYQLHFRSVVKDEFIAAMVNDDEDFNGVYWGARFINKTDSSSQSDSVRSFILEKFNSLFAVDQLQIEKHPSGYPILLNANGEMDIPISFAHHDCYVSYSFRILK